jgi:hypothetical protein
MKIGIDISQIAHQKTGVANYMRELVSALVRRDTKNEYVLFGASLRKQDVFHTFMTSLGGERKGLTLIVVPIPPTILTILWNRLHILPIEFFIGNVDVFWSSDWTQPPLAHARGITTIHDVSFLRFPDSFVSQIIDEQNRRLKWAKRECEMFLCDSKATQKDVIKYLGIERDLLRVVYPGFTVTL